MVERLGETLGLPTEELHALLMAAGHAPASREGTATPFEHARHALDIVLRQQEPFPSLVVDSRWNIVMRNAALARAFGPFREGYEMAEPLAGNVLHLICHPKGLRRFMVDWESSVAPLIQAVQREAADSADPAAAGLRDEILSNPEIPKRWERPLEDASAASVQMLRLRRDEVDLMFHTR